MTTIALSIKQPWAWLIVHGYKDAENRTWQTKFRGPFLVHAGKHFDRDGYEQAARMLRSSRGVELPPPEAFQTGGIVGMATVVDCVRRCPSIWFTGPFGLTLADAKPLDFKPMRGQLKFFEVPA
jgi:hypothetical protein